MWMDGRVSVPPIDLNNRTMHYAVRRSCATRRHRSDGGDELQIAGFEGVPGWDPFVSPTWRVCPDAFISAPYLGWI